MSNEQEAFRRGFSRGQLARENAMDDTPPSWLSGEWAGESIPELLGDLLEGATEDEYAEICDEYERGAEAGWDSLEDAA